MELIRQKRKIIPFILNCIAVGLVFSILMGLVTSASLGNTYGMPVFPDVIENYDYNSAVSAGEINFAYKWEGGINKRAKPELNDAGLSGHIVINDSFISFYGYDSFPFFDAVFAGAYQLSTLEFDFIPGNIDFTNITKTGFWINASISDDNKITGYMIAVSAAEQLNFSNTAKKMEYSLFYVESMDISSYNDFVRNFINDNIDSNLPSDSPDGVPELIEDHDITIGPEIPSEPPDGVLEPEEDYDITNGLEISLESPDGVTERIENHAIPAGPTGCTLLETYSGTDMMDSSVVHFRVESSGSSFQVYITPDGQSEIILFDKEIGSDAARGFGFYTHHGSKNCNEMVCARYGNVYIKDAQVKETSAGVHFKLSGTDTSIAGSQMKNGLSGGQYKVIPPEIKGYRYTGASRELLDPLVYDENPENNITDLFYIAEEIIKANTENIEVSPLAFGSGFVNEPPRGTNITNLFNLVPNTNSFVDSQYPNVAVITPDATYRFGGMWAKEKLDLNMCFSTKMYLHLGHSEKPPNTNKVADGMTFTMHNHEPALANMIGGRGEGLGVWSGRDSSGEYDGIMLPNALVIEFDTYQNVSDGKKGSACVVDPIPPDSTNYAHCALVYPKPISYESEHNLTASDHINTFFFAPTQNWVLFEVIWEPHIIDGVLGGTLTYIFGGTTMTHEISDVNAVFNGTTVWWGFTGSTGAQTSLQAAAIEELPTQEPSSKKVAENSAAGAGGSAVKTGDEITYEITYINGTGQTADLTITDILPDGLEYLHATDQNGNPITEFTKDDKNIVWTITGVPVGGSGSVTITARVTTDADTTVKNTAKLEWRYGNKTIDEEVYAENPVAPKITVTINYVDRNGITLSDSIVEQVHTGTEYNYIIPDFNDYVFDGWALGGTEQNGDPETSFVVTDDTTITLIYVKKNIFHFSFYKVDATTGAPLANAEFKLYLWNGTGEAPDELVPADLTGSGWIYIDTRVSENGYCLVVFENLKPGIYQMVETKAPVGYQLPLGQWRFTADDDGIISILPSIGDTKPPAIKENAEDEVPYSVENIAQYRLPETGGRGIILYTVTGMFLMRNAALLIVISLRRKNRKPKIAS